jgi:thiamine biosynthesis lipoprotein
MKKNRLFIYLAIFGFFFLIGYFLGDPDVVGGEENVRRTVALGTVVEIQTRDDPEDVADAIDAAFAEFARIDSLLSTYREESPVRRLNDGADSALANEEIADLLRRSRELAELSGGAFDPAIGRLIDAWGFERELERVPSDEEIDSALARSGVRFARTNGDTTTLQGGVALNFGAVAKGYAVDRAARILDEAGIEEYLINAGGEIAMRGEWTVGVRHPRERDATYATLTLEDARLGTSGDYERYFIADGKRYHHLLDPRSGRPARGAQSATVIAEDATAADALATAAFVLGPERGVRLIEEIDGAEALIIDADGEEHTTRYFYDR